MVRRDLIVENHPPMEDVRFLEPVSTTTTLYRQGWTTASGWRSCDHDRPTVSGPSCSNTSVHVLADAVLA